MSKKARGMSNPVRSQVLKRMSLLAPFVPAGFVLEKMTANYRKVMNQFACGTQENINKFASLTAQEILKEAHTQKLIDEMQLASTITCLMETKLRKEYFNTYLEEGFTRRCPIDCTYANRGQRTRCKAGFAVRALGGLMYHRSPCGQEQKGRGRAVD